MAIMYQNKAAANERLDRLEEAKADCDLSLKCNNRLVLQSDAIISEQFENRHFFDCITLLGCTGYPAIFRIWYRAKYPAIFESGFDIWLIKVLIIKKSVLRNFAKDPGFKNRLKLGSDLISKYLMDFFCKFFPLKVDTRLLLEDDVL